MLRNTIWDGRVSNFLEKSVTKMCYFLKRNEGVVGVNFPEKNVT